MEAVELSLLCCRCAESRVTLRRSRRTLGKKGCNTPDPVASLYFDSLYAQFRLS